MAEENNKGKMEENSSKTGTKPEAHVAKFKKKVVEEIVKLMKEYPIIGAINMENMPSASLQNMRGQLRGKVVMRMTKRRLMKYAFDEVKKDKKGIENLVPHLKGMPALLFTKENPFSLFKTIKKNKTPAAAKAGQIAPKDIEIKAGPTPFAPGPVISELGALGIKSKVEDGKILIIENKVVVKEGEEVQNNVASLLQRLGIEPMEIGLDLVAVYEDGIIYDKKVLDVDEEVFMGNLQKAARWAFNLAVEIGHFTKETISVLIPKAAREAIAVALEADFMTDDTKEEILAKAERQANALKDEAGIEVGAKKAPVKEKKEAETPKEKPKEGKSPQTQDLKSSSESQQAEISSEAETKPEVEVKTDNDIKKEAEVEGQKAVETELKKEAEEEKKEAAPAEETKPSEEPKPDETPKAKVEREEKEVKEELKEIKEEVEEQKEHPNPEKLAEIKEEVEEVEEKLDKVEEEKQELPSTEKVIIDAIEKNKEAAVVKPVILEKKEGTPERKVDVEKKKAAEESEKLFQQLKQEGTLRNVKKEEPKLNEPMSPQDIIAQAHKKMEKGEVPSAHDLLKKKLQKK